MKKYNNLKKVLPLEGYREDMKNTALTETHKALGAKIVPFAGYNMPVQYLQNHQPQNCRI